MKVFLCLVYLSCQSNYSCHYPSIQNTFQQYKYAILSTAAQKPITITLLLQNKGGSFESFAKYCADKKVMLACKLCKHVLGNLFCYVGGSSHRYQIGRHVSPCWGNCFLWNITIIPHFSLGYSSRMTWMPLVVTRSHNIQF